MRLEDEDGTEVVKLIKVEIAKEMRRLRDAGELIGNGDQDMWSKTAERGVKL